MKKESPKTVVLLDEDNIVREIKSQKGSEIFDSKQSILELLTTEKKEYSKINGVVIGKLVDFGDSGEPLVDFPLNPIGNTLSARSTVILGKEQIGKEIAIMFEEGDPQKPVIIGLVQNPKEEQKPIDLEIDGERMIFKADKEIVLRCGKASITLTKAGKVLIRGAYLLNRSSGVNRIKGGSVLIN